MEYEDYENLSKEELIEVYILNFNNNFTFINI